MSFIHVLSVVHQCVQCLHYISDEYQIRLYISHSFFLYINYNHGVQWLLGLLDFNRLERLILDFISVTQGVVNSSTGRLVKGRQCQIIIRSGRYVLALSEINISFTLVIKFVKQVNLQHKCSTTGHISIK